MSKVNPGRMTAIPEDDFVVFLIGMRFNNPLAIHRWLPIFTAMPKMLRELHTRRELGFRSYEMWMGRTLILVQYWESAEKLIDYAKATDSEHFSSCRYLA
jgi:hypothetical protein